MYSIKPGRGPSLIGAIFALVIGVPFIIFWIGKANEIGAPGFFTLFSLAILVFLLVSVGRSLYNATARNRISECDITTKEEESDPFDKLLVPTQTNPVAAPRVSEAQSPGRRFCPFCGTALEQVFQFCPKCGKSQHEAPGT